MTKKELEWRHYSTC